MIGERIKRARNAVGLSMRAAGELAGLSAMAISKIERGLVTPASQTLIRLARALDTPLEYFFRPETADLSGIEYRKRAALGAKQLKRIEADVLEQVERYLELQALFPQPPVKEFAIPDGLPEEVDDLAQIELIALRIRKAWRLGERTIQNVIDVLEENGVLVLTTAHAGGGRFDGMAAQADGFPVIVVGTDWPGDRQRFTLAHELGHLVMEGRLAAGLNTESACHRFAGAFLAPKPAVVSEFGVHRKRIEPRELYNLKHEYGLSMWAWIYRARDVNIISNKVHDILIKTFSSRGWRKKEPGDPYPSESPKMFEQLVVRAHAEDMISTSKAAELMRTPVDALRDKLSMEGLNAPADQ